MTTPTTQAVQTTRLNEGEHVKSTNENKSSELSRKTTKSAMCFAAAAIGLGLAAALAATTGGMAVVPILAAAGIAFFVGGSVLGAFSQAIKSGNGSQDRPLTTNDLIGSTGIHYLEPRLDEENR